MEYTFMKRKLITLVIGISIFLLFLAGQLIR